MRVFNCVCMRAVCMCNKDNEWGREMVGERGGGMGGGGKDFPAFTVAYKTVA